ncbi:ATP synthase subunit I [Bacillus sp. AK128]
MADIKDIFVRHKKYILFLLAAYVLAWGFTPYQTFFLGLIFGTTLSLYNLWLMVRKIERFGQAIAEGKRVSSIGTFTRLASGALVVLISLRYPEYIHIAGAILGLMTSYIVIMIDIIIQFFLNGREKR